MVSGCEERQRARGYAHTEWSHVEMVGDWVEKMDAACRD